jgi:hypothetical protein
MTMTTTKSVLATLLVLGSSTAAFAKPIVRDHREAAQTVAVRDHRTASSYRDRQNFGRGGDRDGGATWGDRDGDRNNSWSSWTTLASSALVGGEADIYPSTELGRFLTLQLTADHGDTYVSKLVIQFGDYTRQTITVNREIGPGTAPLTIELAGGERAIHSIVVAGSERPGACFNVRAV